MKKIVALSSIAVMMLVGNNTVFANECLLNEANGKEFIQEYKGVEQDIRLNSAPPNFFNSKEERTDKVVDLNSRCILCFILKYIDYGKTLDI